MNLLRQESEENIFFKNSLNTVIKDDQIERLMSFNNVFITPFKAFFIKEAVDEIGRITMYNFNSFEDNSITNNEVNFN
jgi:D-lactate dehydrogenase